LYLSALLSKSACILLPAGFFLVDVLVYTSLQPQLPLPSGRQCFSYVTGKSPVAATLLTFLAVMLGSNYYGMHRDTDVLTLTLGERVIKAAAMPAWVLRRILWPTKLRPHYQLRPGELRLTNPEYLLSLSASAMAASFALWLFLHRRAPQHLLALAYFAIMVLPVSGLIQHGMVSVGCDRYAYLCSVVAVPYGGAVLARLLFAGDQDDGKVVGHEDKPHAARLDHRRAVSVGGALLTGALLFISTNLAGVWRNEDALYEYSLRMDPADWRVMDQRAEHFINTGRYTVKDEAFRHLLELAYHFTPMGTLKAELLHLKLLLWLDEMDPACDGYMQLLELHPESCHVHNNAAVCLLQRGEVDQARLEFERALRSPGYEDVHNYPRGNLKALDDWLALKEAAEARGEEATVPNMETKVMF
jgi:tetratricopeptide (TPR) repeat protein